VQRPESAKLKAEKGINLADTALSSPALTDGDRDALAVIAPHAKPHLVELRRPGSIFRPIATSERPSERLPVAVMTARGDLAIEVGDERLAEVQEEILWLCEAAHVPTIWATQVAESLAKHGVPTRAEVTDAAWASRAECVMLDKGPHIADAIRFIDDVFARMHEHQDKRTSLLRRLSVAAALDGDSSDHSTT
jgi:pyruvate kinase